MCVLCADSSFLCHISQGMWCFTLKKYAPCNVVVFVGLRSGKSDIFALTMYNCRLECRHRLPSAVCRPPLVFLFFWHYSCSVDITPYFLVFSRLFWSSCSCVLAGWCINKRQKMQFLSDSGMIRERPLRLKSVRTFRRQIFSSIYYFL